MRPWQCLRCFGLLVALTAAGAEIPAGAELEIRLKTHLASNTARAKDRVEARLIVAVKSGERIALPAGTVVRGQVKDASAAGEDGRATLEIEFSELLDGKGKPVKISTRLLNVDNARETVDDAGRIQGILARESYSGMMDRGIERLATRYPEFAAVLAATKSAVVRKPDAEIVYEPGVEMTLRLIKALPWEGSIPVTPLAPIGDAHSLTALVESQPFQTTAERPRRPSDLTNLMFLGTASQITAAFAAAGWSPAAELNDASSFETFRAIVENRGYKEAPVSTLLLEGRPPDLVFQKGNNTFAKRHHLRIWRRPRDFQGSAVWVSAATHDVSIVFSRERMTFTHGIDPLIDRERAKVVNDLLFTGRVKGLALVARPDVPTHSNNATGDPLETDGRMAVLLIR